MAQHAVVVNRKIGSDDSLTIVFEISDDTAGVLGRVKLDGNQDMATLKTELQAEAARLLALPVGTTIDL